MAIQAHKDLLKSPGIGLEIASLKFKWTNTGTVTVLSGQELLANGGTATCTTGTNACVATITLNSSLIDVVWIEADYRDDGASGDYTTISNVLNEGTSTSLSFQVNMFANAGNTLTTANTVNLTGTTVGVAFIYRDRGVDTGN